VRAGAAWEIGERDDDPYGFAAWPVIDFVGKHGLSHPRESLDALRRLTPLFSAEFAIRPFLVHHEALTMTRLRKWTRDGDEHVRRLVSEGTRPRLPWGERLAKLQRDPTPVLRLLERLKDDRAEYVRRSVANNLNDISKDHPQVVVDVARSWSRGASDERRRIIRHATRTLVKSGHPGALAVLGFDPRARVSVADLSVTPKRLTLGGSLAIRFVLRSRARTAQPLVVDYAVHHVKKSGERKAKVFKLKVLELGAGDRVTIEKRHAIRQISTRQYHSGRHAVDILVNGRACARAEFDLRV
jgi:3-methyladenine DNA glycosylase AlkC